MVRSGGARSPDRHDLTPKSRWRFRCPTMPNTTTIFAGRRSCATTKEPVPRFCCAKGTSSDEIALRLEHLIPLLVSLTRPFPTNRIWGREKRSPGSPHTRRGFFTSIRVIYREGGSASVGALTLSLIESECACAYIRRQFPWPGRASCRIDRITQRADYQVGHDGRSKP